MPVTVTRLPPRIQRGWLGAAITAALLVAACSGRSPNYPTPTYATQTQPPAKSSATPIPTIDLAALGREYLALATVENHTADTLYAKYGKSASLAAQRSYVAGLAKAVRTFDDGLRLLAFPPADEADVKALEAADAKYEVELLLGAAATSSAAWNATIAPSKAANVAVAVASDLVRHDLGLPSVPIK